VTFIEASAEAPDRDQQRPHPDVDIKELVTALADVLKRSEMFESHQVEMEKLSTRERMSQVMENLRDNQFVPFVALFHIGRGTFGCGCYLFGSDGINKRVTCRNCTE
jgi:segregation and condensation protein A